MENIPTRYIIIWISILVFAMLFVYIHLMGVKYESLGKVHLLYLINQKISNINKSFDYIGYCEEVSVLLGILYNLVYNKPFYIVNYPSIQHVAVILNNTLYTTSYLESPFKITYMCYIDPMLREKILTTNNKALFDLLIRRLSTPEPIVICKPVISKNYKNKVLFAGVKIYPWNKIVEWSYNKNKFNIEKILVK